MKITLIFSLRFLLTVVSRIGQTAFCAEFFKDDERRRLRYLAVHACMKKYVLKRVVEECIDHVEVSLIFRFLEKTEDSLESSSFCDRSQPKLQ